MEKEIGGYIELEHFSGHMLHEGALALNCGRNALAYLIEARNIKRIKLPYFMCDSIKNLCLKMKVEIRYYHIDDFFFPKDMELLDEEWLYLSDFYGQLEKEDIQRICEQCRKVIVDYAQAYFEMPLEGVDSIYTCRKFFGVSDGAFLYTNARIKRDLEQDESFDKMGFLLGRYEKAAAEFHGQYVENNKRFENEPVKKMSKLTKNLLCGIDYERIKNIRTDNYALLHNYLGNINQLKLKLTDGAFAYPLFIKNGAEIRRKLIVNKIYIPILWPNVIRELSETMLEYQMAENILPLPCDQRYGTEEMKYICELIFDNFR